MVTLYALRDLRKLYKILKDARAKWKEIGLLLGLSMGDINAIEKDNLHDTSNCLMSCLDLWLHTEDSDKKTDKHLASVLLDVSEPGLAAEIYPPIKEQWQYTLTWLKCNVGVAKISVATTLVFALLGVILHSYLHYGHSVITDEMLVPGVTYSLPLVEENDLVGRKEEVKQIMQYLGDNNVQVVTLFGSPGFGKSAIAKLVGNLFLLNGTDVHYVYVEGLPDVNSLKEKLIETSGTDKPVTFVHWIKNITRETLIILDNVDGYDWVQDKSRREFQNQFLSILQDHSRRLKILITSQQEIHSSKSFRSYQLLSLDSENCVNLLRHSVAETEVSGYDAAVICELIGGVPLAINVIAATLSPPVSSPVDYVIERLNDTLKLYFLAEKGNLTEKDKILSALTLAFQYIKKEHQICALLSARFTGSFTHDIISSILTPDVMVPFSDNFYMQDCLYDLNMKSFIEVIRPIGGKKPIKYHFHTLIRSFLEITVSKFKVSETLNVFWKKYLNWLNSDHGENWLITSLAKEDLKILIKESLHRTDHSYYLAVSIASNRLFVNYINGMFGAVWNHQDLYREMLRHSIDSLISDCEKPGLSFPITSVARVILAYTIVFEENVCLESSDCVEHLQSCQPKIESLRYLAAGSYDAMKASSYFYNNILTIKCLEAKVTTGGCDSLWKYSLLGIGEMLVEVEKKCTEYCSELSVDIVSSDCATSKDNSSLVILGLEAYALKEYKKAVQLFNSLLETGASGHSCSELEQALVYMAMYDIHDNFNKLDEADHFIMSIRRIGFQQYNMSCYTAIYDDTVIPFLKEANETQLARELRDLKFDSYMDQIANCEGNPLNCNNMRYKTPILKVLLQFSALWIEKVLKSDSLLCAITKEVMAGCNSPFPFITDILEAQSKYGQAMRSFLVEGI